MRILLVGHGKMNRLIASLAAGYGGEVVGVVDSKTVAAAGPAAAFSAWRGRADVAIDFTVPGAVATNVPLLAKAGINVVLGTTGWTADAPQLRQAVAAAGIGIVAAANFSTGVVLFEAIVQYAAERLASHEEYGAWLHEAHHQQKKDAPSGTALVLKQAMEAGGYRRPIDVSSTRAGYIPGTHTIGFDGPSDAITLTHAARDRGGFARGALVAARWVIGRRGWFDMHDVLALRDAGAAAVQTADEQAGGSGRPGR
jgi:4-hydroxy-tetrahydrodipicolinate reductase